MTIHSLVTTHETLWYRVRIITGREAYQSVGEEVTNLINCQVAVSLCRLQDDVFKTVYSFENPMIERVLDQSQNL